jgi:hypothetical protein
MNGLRCGPRGKEKFPAQAQNVAWCMGLLVREWANMSIFFLWKQFSGPGLGTAWCAEAQCMSGLWAQIFSGWAGSRGEQ